jgi:hypothetical protein
MAEKTAVDLMNDALGLESSGEADPNAGVPEDEPAVSESDAKSSESDDSGASGKVEEAELNENADDESEVTEGDGTITTASAPSDRNPDGTFKKKGQEPKQPDAVNDPIPKDVKQETRARMQSLIDTTKEVTAERDKFKQDFDYLIQGVQATGATPEQYGEALSWLSLFNSGNPADQVKALELIESVADRLATFLGKDRSVSDPLARHEDLKAAVARREITAEYAKEIARQRNGVAFRTEISTSQQQRQQQETVAAQTLQQARNDLTALEANLRAVDGAEYEAIKSQIVGPLKPLMAAINPSQWHAKFIEAYKMAKESRAQMARAPVAPKIPANQPLRGGKNPAGGQARAPASALEAMTGALASMNK